MLLEIAQTAHIRFARHIVKVDPAAVLCRHNALRTQHRAESVGILQRFPFSMALIVFFVIVTMISFVTLVDPMTSVLATISTKGISAEEEAPKFLKVLWGGNMGGVALAVITLCGISALRGMFVFGGVLMMLLTIILCWCIVKEGQNILARNKREDTP